MMSMVKTYIFGQILSFKVKLNTRVAFIHDMLWFMFSNTNVRFIYVMFFILSSNNTHGSWVSNYRKIWYILILNYAQSIFLNWSNPLRCLQLLLYFNILSWIWYSLNWTWCECMIIFMTMTNINLQKYVAGKANDCTITE